MKSARFIVHLILSLAGFGRSASSEVVLHLVRSKCIPVLLYGLDAFQVAAASISLIFL